MTKRMKRIAALLTCGLVLASGTSVYAETVYGKIEDAVIWLDVTTRRAKAETGGNYSSTTIYGYRHVTGGSANQLIAMTPVSGGAAAEVYAPNGWDIGKADSAHYHAGITQTLTAYP